VKEYDIYVPHFYNDGTPVEPDKLHRLQDQLFNFFRGLTFFPQPNQGYWTMGNVTFRDEIMIYRVITIDAESARRFLRQLKVDLKRDLRQEEVLIVEREVDTL